MSERHEGVVELDDPGLVLPGSQAEEDDGAERLSLRVILRAASTWRELRTSPYGLKPVLILALAGFFVEMNTEVLLVGSVAIAQDLDVTIEGIIRFAVFAGTVLAGASVLVAWWADRHPRVPLFAVGVAAAGVVLLFAARAQTGLQLGVPVIASTALLVAGTVPVASLFADYYPPGSRGKAFAAAGLFAVVGGFASPLFAGELIDTVGWRATYAVTAIALVVVGVLAGVRLREPVRGYMERRALGSDEASARIEDEPPSLGEAWRTVFGVRTLRRVFFANMVASSGRAVYGLSALIFYTREYGFGPLELGRLAAAAAVFAIPGFYVGGGLVDWLMRRRPAQVLNLVAAFSILSAVGTLVLPLAPPVWVLVLSNGLIAFGSTLLGPALGVLYTQVVPPNVRTLAGAVTNLATVPARLIFLPLVGVIIVNYGTRSGLLLPFPLFLAGAVILATASRFFELDMRAAFSAATAREEWRRARREGRDKLLVCRDIEVEYNGVQVLFGVDFDVEDGQIIALLGTNGAGKSTLLRAISGVVTPSGGSVVYDGRDVTFMPPHECAARGIVFMPGGRGVFPGLSVRENLLLGSWLTDDDAEAEIRLREVFALFPALAARIDAAAGSLSGGEQQQLSLAQAFLCKPRLLMIDELSLGLSPAVVGELVEIVKRIRDTGVTVIVVEQSVNVALALAEKAIFMEKGEVRFFGRTEDLLARPDILRAVYVKGTGALTAGAPARASASPVSADGPALLHVEQITKRFGGVTALADVDLDVRDGQVLGLIGPNGSGKTTLFEIISGYQAPDAGVVRYEGIDITGMSPEERARLGLVRRFQDARLFPSLTVYETLLVALEQKLEVRSSVANGLALPQARRAERRVRVRADRLIELLELGSYRDKFVKELSTGLRRIVDLACVLATEPKLLLLDEPSTGIAQAEAEGLGPLLKRVRFETGCTMLVIEHDMPLLSAVSDELVALDQGSVLTRGTPDQVLNDDRVIQAYLGGAEMAVKRSGSLV